ncbi:phage minor head protein [Stakelama pacifica]|uniref:Phage Mu protein F like protein n=1 Tax=Stakelama pacifica TaxID=517720 RepID=A0A4R6FJW2_9SPHN|nr:phage minor head protein [Stakelama pacifica]TDN81771.1 phage Mu protein F like protein [Stakelama pacifica]GGO96523.1 hypothetical protein GCM10011329_23250 [Stakelama pacifica]
MPRYDLASMARRQRNFRRSAIVFRDIRPPAMLATDLYQRCYKPVVDLWASAADTIIAQYASTIDTMTTDAPADISGAIDGASNTFDRLFITLTASLRDWVLRTEQWQRGSWRGAVLSATGVDLGTLLGPADVRATMDTYIEWNTKLIRNVSDEARKKIGDAVFSGLTQRQPARDVAARIREVVGMSQRRSINIASDQLSKISSELADERRREAGLSVWQWVSSHKLHPREWHQARDGNLYSEEADMQGKTVNGKTVAEPPARDDWPGRPPYCGCRSKSVLVLD